VIPLPMGYKDPSFMHSIWMCIWDGYCELNTHSSFVNSNLVEVIYNPYIIISHYCNNIFALQYAHIHNLCFDSKHTQLYSSLKHHIHVYFI
jgi:hypothetical protein